MPPTNVDTEYPFGCGLDAKSDNQVAAQNGGYACGFVMGSGYAP